MIDFAIVEALEQHYKTADEYIQGIDEYIEILEPGYNPRGAYKRKDAKKI